MNDYCVSDEDKAKIRQPYNVTDTELKLQLKLLKDWALTKSDLPVESQDEHFVNAVLLRSKFREDTAKLLIENYFKYMRKYPEIFQNLGKFKPSEEVGIAVAVPKKTPSFERVTIFKFLPRNMATKPLDMHQLVLIAITTSVLMNSYDYGEYARCLVDFKKITVMSFFKLNLMQLYKLVSIVRNMFKLRISGIDVVNAPTIVHLVLGAAKAVLSKKVLSRVTVHSDYSSLQKSFPLECLPSDYGGKAESTEQLVEKWDEIVESHQLFFRKIADLSQGNVD